jgi:hypothetical protein
VLPRQAYISFSSSRVKLPRSSVILLCRCIFFTIVQLLGFSYGICALRYPSVLLEIEHHLP